MQQLEDSQRLVYSTFWAAAYVSTDLASLVEPRIVVWENTMIEGIEAKVLNAELTMTMKDSKSWMTFLSRLPGF